MEENLGKVITRYYVVKTSGIFSKNNRLLEVHDEGFAFVNPNKSKSAKGKEICMYKELSDVSNHNEKDLAVKCGKQSFTVTCNERPQLLTDLLYQKDIWDLANNSVIQAKVPFFRAFRQVDLSDPASKVAVSLQVLRSAILVKYSNRQFEEAPKGEEKKEKIKQYAIRFVDIEAIIPTPTGILIGTKVEYERYLMESEAIVPLLDTLKEVPRKYIGINLAFKAEQSFVEKKVFEPDEYSVFIKVKKFGGLVKEVRIHVDASMLVEEDPKDKRIILKIDLSSIMCIKVKKKPDRMSTLKFCLQHSGICKYAMKDNELDYLLSNIAHSLQTREETESIPLIFLEPALIEGKIYGFGPEPDSGFEAYIKKELEKGIGLGDFLDARLNESLMEATLNVGFRSIGYDAKVVASLFGMLGDIAQVVLKFEEDPAALKSYVEYMKRTSKSAPPEGESPTKITSESGKILGTVYQRLPLMLAVIRSFLYLRSTLPDIPAFQKHIDTLLLLAGSKNSIVSISASVTLRCLLRLNKSNEKRLETATKKWVIRELDIINKVVEAITPYMESTPQDFLSKFLAKEEIHDCPYLQLYGLLSIFEVIFMGKREITHSDDLQYIVSSILDHDKVLLVIEQLSMYNSKPIMYQASLIIAQTFLLLHNGTDKAQFQAKQMKVLIYTTVLLWNIRLLLSSSSLRQQRLSASVAALIIFGNPECCALLSRMFPKAILKKVYAEKGYVEWKPEQWKEFFVLVQNNYGTATEQWNEECRIELGKKLKQIALDYYTVKSSKRLDVKEERIRWNHEECSIKYSCLEQKCKVGKYYLRNLLCKGEGLFPYLTEVVMDPVKFWNKLVHKFLSITDVEEQKLILTVLNLVYHDHFQMIRDIKILPYFVHLLEKEINKPLFTLSLELIYNSLKVKFPEVVLKNYQMIIQGNGLTNLINLLCRTYAKKGARNNMEEGKEKEGESKDKEKDIKYSILSDDKEEKKIIEEPKLFKEKKIKEVFAQRINRGGLIIRIFDLMLKATDKKCVHPVSQVRAFCEDKINLSATVQTLLVENIELRKKTMKFISNYFITPKINLKETGIVDFLMMCLNEITGTEALQLLIRIQSVFEEYNNDLDFTKFTMADSELISTNDKIKNSLFLRYFPVPFVKYIVEESNPENILRILLSPSVEEPTLLWSSEMRNLLIKSLQEHLTTICQRLEQFVANKADNFRRINNMPVYSVLFLEVMKYPQIANEIRCAEYYLRIWNVKKGGMETVHQIVFQNNLEKTFKEVTSNFPSLNLDDFKIVVDSFSLANSNFTKKSKFPCFPMLLRVIEKISDSIQEFAIQTHLKTLLKFIYRILRIDMNATEFEEAKGCVTIITTLQKWMQYVEEKKYETLNAVDGAGLKWGLAIIWDSVEKNPILWNSIEYKIRESFLKSLFELVYKLNSVLYSTEYLHADGKPSLRIKFQLNNMIRVQKYQKFPNVEYNKKGLTTILKESGDVYAVSMMLHLVELITGLVNVLSQTTDSQKEIIQTGWGVMGLWYVFAGDTLNWSYLKTLYSIDYLQGYSLISFRHLAGFSIYIKGDLKEPLKSFADAVSRMFGDHILNMITANLEVVAHRIKEAPSKNIADGLQAAIDKITKNIDHPQCIWNESTRKELKKAVLEQIEVHHASSEVEETGYGKVIGKLEYSAYKEEIIVDGVFVRVLNKDPYMRLANPTRIMKVILQNLEEVKIPDLEGSQPLLTRTIALFEALNNILAFQKGLELSTCSQESVVTLCRFFEPSADSIPKHKETIYGYVFSVLNELIKDGKLATNLVSTKEFIRFGLSGVIRLSNELVTKRILSCLESIVALREADEYIISSGFLIVFLFHAFTEGKDKRYRGYFLKFSQQILARRYKEGKLPGLTKIVPKPILDQIIDFAPEKFEDVFAYIDKNKKELTIAWNDAIRSKVREALAAEVKALDTALLNAEATIAWKEPAESYIADVMNKGELVVSDVVLSVYNTCAYVKFKTPFSKFLDELSERLHKYTVLMQLSRQMASKKGEEEGKMEEVKSKDVLQEYSEIYQNGITCMLTSLMLAYEQLYRNPFNLNKVASDMMVSRSSSPSKETTTCSAFKVVLIKEILVTGLRSANSIELIITILEIVNLLIEQKEILGKEELQAVGLAAIQAIVGMVASNEDAEKAAQVLLLCVLYKLVERVPMTKAKDPLLDTVVNVNLFEKMRVWHSFKPELKPCTEAFINKLCQYPAYYKMLVSELKYELSPDIKLDKIAKGKYEGFDRVWRKPPTKMDECKMYESICSIGTFDTSKINLRMLPLVSGQTFLQTRFEEAANYFVTHYGAYYSELTKSMSDSAALLKK